MTESVPRAHPGAAPAAPRGPDRRLLAVLLLGLALGTSVNLPGAGFAGDAVPWVAANPLLHGLDHPLEIIASPYRTDVAPAHSPWRPVTSLTHALSWSTGAGQPAAYHAFDVALHGVVTLLVFALLLTLGATSLAATCAAAMFAVHPLHVEAVASIVGRADVLVACFALLAVLAHLRLRAALHVPLVALAYLLALGAKESGVVVPGLLFAVELARAPDLRTFLRSTLRQWPLWLALLGVLVLYFAARHAVLGTFTGLDVAPYIASLPDHLRITTAVANWVTYARLLFLPFELSVDYGPAVTLPAGLATPRFWAGLLLLAGGLWLALRYRRRAPLAALGVLWFTVAVFPVTNLLVLTPVWVAERTLYAPSVAVALLLAAAADALAGAGARERRVAGVAFGLVMVLFAARTWQRNRTWENGFVMTRTLVEERPESFRAAWWLARLVGASGDHARAAALYARADSLLPGSAGILGDYAGLLLDAGRPAEAEAVLRRLPADASADMGIYRVRAIALQGRLDEAAAVLDTLALRFPQDWRLPDLARQVDSLRTAR